MNEPTQGKYLALSSGSLARYAPCLWRAVHRVTRNAPQEREDAWAVALTATWKAREAGATENLVYRIAYCKCLHYMRDKVPNPAHFGHTFDGGGWPITDSLRCSWDGGLQASEARLVLEGLLALVTEKQRRTIRLLFLENWTGTEIADMEGCHIGAVYERAARGVRAIRTAIGQDALEDGVVCSDGKLGLSRNYNPLSDERRAALSVAAKNVRHARKQKHLAESTPERFHG